MVEYYCNQCGYSTTSKYKYLRHCNRKYKCTSTTKTIPKKDLGTGNLTSGHHCSQMLTNAHSSSHAAHKCSFSADLSPILLTNAHKCSQNNLPDNIQKDLHNQEKETELSNDSNIIIKKTVFQCTQCSKTFVRNSNLQRHIQKYCKGTVNLNNNENTDSGKSITELVQIIKEQNEQIKAKDTELSKIYKDGRIINNIIINSYGNEDISYLTSTHIRNLLMGTEEIIPRLTREIHCNPDHPENMNVYHPNKKDKKYLMHYKNDQWSMCNGNLLLTNMIHDKITTIDKYLGECNNISPNEAKKFQQLTDAEESEQEKWKDAIQIDMYNNKNLLTTAPASK
jgi:hypothetical protein